MSRWAVFAKQVSRKVLDDGDETSLDEQTKSFRLWMWSSAAGLSIILISTVIAHHRSRASQEDASRAAIAEPATSLLDQLPEGHTIAPIEPVNIDALDSLLESHGYADLYSSDRDGAKGQRIARGLPIVRVPRNPRQFAVIVADSKTSIFSQLSEPVMVVLRKKPGTDSHELEKKSKTKRESPRAAIELIEEDDLPESVEGGDREPAVSEPMP